MLGTQAKMCSCTLKNTGQEAHPQSKLRPLGRPWLLLCRREGPPVDAVAHSPHCHVASAKHVGFKGPGARGRREVSHNPRRPVLAVPTHPANGAEAVASSALQQPLGRASAQVWLRHGQDSRSCLQRWIGSDPERQDRWPRSTKNWSNHVSERT